MLGWQRILGPLASLTGPSTMMPSRFLIGGLLSCATAGYHASRVVVARPPIHSGLAGWLGLVKVTQTRLCGVAQLSSADSS
jgi:hypothetical protein